ncbi:retropepsin-like aspartic protease [Sphingomonas sp. PL20]|uniref:retropepsin-like aspartic protease n=1 Tax=Sphingomonas sp. PL20 TaxID=2760712 RepID=UPI002FEF283D
MGDTLMVSAEVAGSPVRAILDSGSAASIINTRLVESLDIAPSGKRIIRGTGGRVEVTEISDVALTVADDRRRLPFAIVSDLAAISSAFGRPIDLVLGEDILAGRCVALDFTQDRIGFAPTGSFAGGSGWRRLPLTHGTRSDCWSQRRSGAGAPCNSFSISGAQMRSCSLPPLSLRRTSSPARPGRPRRWEASMGSRL